MQPLISKLNSAAIVCFRNDLRLADNQALSHAIAHHTAIIPLWRCPDFKAVAHDISTEISIPKYTQNRVKYLLEAVSDLKTNLQSLGADLLITNNNHQNAIIALAIRHNVTHVYIAKELAHEELTEDLALEKALWAHKIKTEWFETGALLHHEDLPFPVTNLPDIFTGYRKEVEKIVDVRLLVPTPTQITTPEVENWGSLPNLAQMQVASLPFVIKAPVNKTYPYIGGQTAAHARLKYYLDDTRLITTYKDTRNGLLGNDFSTRFSAALANGSVSPRELFYSIKKYEAKFGEDDGTYWVVFELLWRDYFRLVHRKYGSAIFRIGGIKNKGQLPYTPTAAESALFKCWATGTTGVPLVDAIMVELAATGFISNRGRQNAASFLVHNLKLDWRLGAAWFEAHLLDYDVYSNWGNWCYVAGVGNDPRPNRYFNITKQTQQYDVKASYIKYWLPVLDAVPPAICAAPLTANTAQWASFGVRLGVDYPAAIASTTMP